VHGLEEVVLLTLGTFGIKARRRKGAPGIWIDDATKIASVGVRVRNFVTTHGLGLNVTNGEDSCGLIVVCGMPDVRTTSLASILGRSSESATVADLLIRFLSLELHLSFERVDFPGFVDHFPECGAFSGILDAS
jgi:lipoyl(octanoyl) transferase